MLKYLIILLDDTSVSYCHYDADKKQRNLMSVEDLKTAIFWGMKENLMIQYVLPKYDIPIEFIELMESIDNVKIVPYGSSIKGDVTVLEGWDISYVFDATNVYVLRVTKNELFKNYAEIKGVLKKVARLNIVITDIETFVAADNATYKSVLDCFANEIEMMYKSGGVSQLNLLTDRIILNEMNNCNAAVESITVAPNGEFYVCPAFYYGGSESVGSLKEGLLIKNSQLYKLAYSPICRNCDAYQCKRCVWLNSKTTLEINTPSHEQCVVSHLERNKSRELLMSIKASSSLFAGNDNIKEIAYLDPFDVKNKWEY